MGEKPDLDRLLRTQERRTPQNPWASAPEPPRLAYRDPTGETAAGNVDRERRGKR